MVQTWAFDDFRENLKDRGSIDLVKIDLGGAEELALMGMRNVLREDPLLLIVEAIEQQLKRFGSSQAALLQLTSDCGYQILADFDGNLILGVR